MDLTVRDSEDQDVVQPNVQAETIDPVVIDLTVDEIDHRAEATERLKTLLMAEAAIKEMLQEIRTLISTTSRANEKIKPSH